MTTCAVRVNASTSYLSTTRWFNLAVASVGDLIAFLWCLIWGSGMLEDFADGEKPHIVAQMVNEVGEPVDEAVVLQ